MSKKFTAIEKDGYVYWVCPECAVEHLYEELDEISEDVYRCVLCGTESSLGAY